MPISPLPTPPQPTDTQDQFNTKAFAWVAALSTFVTQANALETAADADAATATTKASEASASASAASTSESNAATSATAANNAKVDAESARDATLAAFDSFDDRYLGSKTADPTLDNDGNALVAGALYFNSVGGIMKVYTGSAWVAAYVSPDGLLPLAGGTMTGAITFAPSQVFPIASASLAEFTSSSTWTKPAGAQFVMVQMLGAGGGGGSGPRGASTDNMIGGGGGGGGAYAEVMFDAASLPSTVAVTVGAGGAGAAAQTVDTSNGLAGSAGGTSAFGSFAIVGGGGGGGQGNRVTTGNSTSATGGVAGTPGVFNGGAGGGATSGSGPEPISGGSVYLAGNGGGCGSNAFLSFSGAGGSYYFNDPAAPAPVIFPGSSGTIGSGRQGGAGGAFGAFSSIGSPRTGMCFGNSRFATTTTRGLIATSSNGTNAWTFVNSGSFNAQHILHDGSRFVIFGLYASTCVTTTDFSTFTTRSGLPTPMISSGTSSGVNAVKYVNGRYFVCGNEASTATLWTSTDLISWTKINTGLGAQQVRDICWTGTNYVVTGSSNTPQIRISNNLTTWSTPTGTFTGGTFTCDSNGAGTVVIQTGTTPFGMISTDHGATFTNVATTLTQASNNFSSAFLNSVWFIANGNSLWTSADGNTWTNRISASGDNLGGGIAWDGTTYVIGSSTSSTIAARTSTNLSTWTDRSFQAIDTTGGAGGNGGLASGGGGGGPALNGKNSGAGGNGGNGLVRVYTW